MGYGETDGATTEADAIADLQAKLPQKLPGEPYGLVALDGNIVDFRHMIPAEEVKAIRRTDTEESFVRLVTRLKESTTVAFASRQFLAFQSVIDYSQGGDPSRDEHRVQFTPELHPSWQAWAGVDKKWLDQVEFAEHLEENIESLVSPSGADLLELVLDLRGNRNVSFQSSKRLQDGQTQLSYVEKIDTKGGNKAGLVTVPPEISIRTPVFRGDEPRDFDAFLRFRISDSGGLTFSIRIKNVSDVVPDAFEALTEKVKLDLLDVPVYAGWPSA